MSRSRSGLAAIWLTIATIGGAAWGAPTRTTVPAVGSDEVPQQGGAADDIRRTLQGIRLPEGFAIELFAMVPDARQMAVAADEGAVYIGTTARQVWAVHLRAGRAESVRRFAPSLSFRIPNGVCFAPDGALIVAEFNRVRRIDQPQAQHGAKVQVSDLVPEARLIPVSEEARGHAARVCRVGPDNQVYIAIGQPHNVPPREKLQTYDRVGIGGIVRVSATNGGTPEVFARGIRNSVGLVFAKDGSLWFTDNQTDGMGDDIPAGEVNRATKPGQFFGYPWTNAGTRIVEYGYDKDPLPPNIVEPEVHMDAHAADLGLVFYTGTAFPLRYRGGLFTAQHGSWNRRQPIGARVMFIPFGADGRPAKPEVFAQGWLDEATGSYRGRPVDVAVLNDGSLLVSDDKAGAIYRIFYRGP